MIEKCNSLSFISFLNFIIKNEATIGLGLDDIKYIANSGKSLSYICGIGCGNLMAKMAGEAIINGANNEGLYNGILFSVVGGDEMTLYDVQDVAKLVLNTCQPDANIVFGAVKDEEYHGTMKIELIGVK